MLKYPDRVAKLPKASAPTLESHFVVAETTEGRHFVANPYYFMVDTAGNQLPYISEQDEIYVNEHEVRLLKLVNGEVDYKTQSLALSDAPILLENQEKGNYTVQLKPKIAYPVFSFNLTDENMAKRELFNDIRFRQAMSLAMNRDEINEVVYFGEGEPTQYVAFSPTPEFVDEKWTQYYAEFDPEKAKQLLDEIGMVDTDGDGMRELPNGEKLTLNMQFATQGIPAPVVEMVAQQWKNVGVDTTVKEVTPDEYRSAQSANQLSVHMWEKSQPLAVVLATSELFEPPFENYFFHRNGMLWAEWVATNGEKGVEPPDWVKTMMEDIVKFQSAPVGSPESDALGAKLVENMTSHLVFLGTVKATSPIVHTKRLGNVPEYQTASYEYYWSYPYRPTQWFLTE
jgi:peptide/nickel transport system substrate-binding protein